MLWFDITYDTIDTNNSQVKQFVLFDPHSIKINDLDCFETLYLNFICPYVTLLM